MADAYYADQHEDRRGTADGFFRACATAAASPEVARTIESRTRFGSACRTRMIGENSTASERGKVKTLPRRNRASHAAEQTCRIWTHRSVG